MATLHQLQAMLQQQIKAATQGVVSSQGSVDVQVGIGWPSTEVLTDVAKTNSAVIAIYDMQSTHNTTRWANNVVSQSITPTQLTGLLSAKSIKPNQSVSLTLGGSVTNNDGIAIVLSNPALFSVATTAIAGPGDTLNSLAAKLALNISGSSAAPYITASVEGDVLTITNDSHLGLGIGVNTGNIGSQVTEIGRRSRTLQIAIWTQTEDARQAVTDPIDIWIAQAETGNWPVLADGTFARVQLTNDYYLEDPVVNDVYRRDFHLSVEYSVTVVDQLYPILADVIAFAGEA